MDFTNRFSVVERLVVAVGLAILFFTFASASAKDYDLSRIKRIGVISVVGDRLYQRRLGVTVFGNESENQDVADWGLDAVWEAKIKEEAAAFGDFEFIDLTVDKTPLLAAYPKDNAWPRQWRVLSVKKSAPYLLKIAAENNIDAIIVLGSFGYDVVEDRVAMEGLGMFHMKSLGGVSTVYHLISQLSLIDGATGKPLEQKTLSVGSHWVKGYGGYPVAEAPVEFNGRNFSEYSEDEKLVLRNTLAALPDDAWRRSFGKLFHVEE